MLASGCPHHFIVVSGGALRVWFSPIIARVRVTSQRALFSHFTGRVRSVSAFLDKKMARLILALALSPLITALPPGPPFQPNQLHLSFTGESTSLGLDFVTGDIVNCTNTGVALGLSPSALASFSPSVSCFQLLKRGSAVWPYPGDALLLRRGLANC